MPFSGRCLKGDIGMHFPDTDPRYRGIASTKMLDTVLRIMRRRHFKLVNVDVTLVAQQPKLAPYYAAMKKNIARRFRVAESKISIKARLPRNLDGRAKVKEWPPPQSFCYVHK